MKLPVETIDIKIQTCFECLDGQNTCTRPGFSLVCIVLDILWSCKWFVCFVYVLLLETRVIPDLKFLVYGNKIDKAGVTT